LFDNSSEIFSTKLFHKFNDHLIFKFIEELKLNNAIIFIQIHDIKSHHISEDKILAYIDEKLRTELIKISSGVFTQEKSAIKYIKDKYNLKNKKIIITPLGSYQTFHGKKISKKLAREKLGINNFNQIYAHIGNIRKNRNPESIIREFLKVKQKNSLLILAGIGTEKYKESQNIKIFPGIVDNQQLRNIACASDYIINIGEEYLTSAVTRLAISYHTPLILRKYGSNIDIWITTIFIDIFHDFIL